MTVQELKDFISKIPAKYMDKEVLIETSQDIYEPSLDARMSYISEYKDCQPDRQVGAFAPSKRATPGKDKETSIGLILSVSSYLGGIN